MKIALLRGAFLNQYECQIYYPLVKKHQITAFSSLHPIHSDFPFDVCKLPSPMDLNFGTFSRLKMPILNRLFIDAHWLIGLENKLKGFDLAHVADTFYHFTYQGISAKKRGFVRGVVATIFENIPFNNESIFGRKMFKECAIRNIDHFIAISERSKLALMIEGVNEERITIIGQHIDTNMFLTKKQATNSNIITILFVGRLEFYKGVFDVLFAIKALLLDKDVNKYNLKLKFVGEGSEKEKLILLGKKIGISDYIEFCYFEYKKMPLVYQTADIFVAPSRPTRTYQEQFSTVLLEAQASGLPIVTTGSGGIPENVENAALIAYSGDIYTLSRKLKLFIMNADLRKKYGEMARKHALMFDISLGSKKVEKIYETVLSNTKRTSW